MMSCGGGPGFAASQVPGAASLPTYNYTIVKTYPHDRDAYTQGLQYVDGVLYEGTGLHGRSSIRRVRLDTGEVLQRRDIAEQYFGEGITIRKQELFQLTWQSGIGFVYDRDTFTPRRTFSYRGEGWGLTQDASALIMSDGTEAIRFLEPETFKELRRIKVTAGGAPVKQLNELEYVKGEILANVYQTDYVARIDPKTGRVTAWIDFRGLLTPREQTTAEVFYVIAYDEKGDRLFVTGTLWPKLFEVKLTLRGR